MRQPENVIIIGASGHGKVIADIVLKSGDRLVGFLDDDPSLGSEAFGHPILGKIEDMCKFSGGARFIIGIGDNRIRKQIAEECSEGNDVIWHTAVHPAAVTAADAIIREGAAVMANAAINPSAKIGRHCIINTGAVIEHDNDISDYVHISPNASVGGAVSIGECTHIGIGATVKNNISIASGCLVGAGAVVVKDILEKGTYAGVPARKLR